MKKFSTTVFAFVLTGLAVIALVAIPTAASAAGGMGTTKNNTTCKSGKQVRDAKGCKEYGGKR